jgi:hypothetical protein
MIIKKQGNLVLAADENSIRHRQIMVVNIIGPNKENRSHFATLIVVKQLRLKTKEYQAKKIQESL